MAQIVTEKAISTRCNLIAIQAGGNKENTVLAEGEIWLVDTTNASKIHGYGRYDSYIVGDGTTAAKNLTVNEIDDLTTETDPVFSASPAAGITAQNIQTWNDEPAARQAADTALSNRINTEVSTRADMDDNLRDAIVAEADARQAADNLLRTDLTAEATSRQSSDTALQTAIQDEATARANADALLQQQYNALTQSDIIVGALPATGVPNVIYRVPGTTDFTDYMWYDNQFVPMATYGLPISAEFVVDNNLNKTQEEVNEEVANAIFNDKKTISRSGQASQWDAFLAIPMEAGRTYKITIESATGRYLYLKDHTFIKGTDSGVTLLNLTVIIADLPKTFYYKATTTETVYITNYAAGTYSMSVEGYIENKDLLPTFSDNNNITIDTTENSLSLNKVKSILGHLNTDNTISPYASSRHVVIRVVAGDSLFIVPSSNAYCAIAFVKTYNIEMALPYALDLATNGGFRDVPSSGGTYTVPDDAQYIVIRHTNNTGVNVLPSKFIINGSYDIAKTLWDNVSSVLSNIGTIKNDVDVITDNDYSGYKTQKVQKISYLNGVTKTVNGVSIICNNDGSFVFSGVGTSNGGRTTNLTNTFELKAGNYIAKYNASGTISVPILQDTSYNIIRSFSNPITTFSVDSDKMCFIGFAITNGSSYNGSFTFEILREETISIDKTAYDAAARENIEKIGVPQDYVQKDTLKINNIISGVLGNQGMCVIDGYLCSCQVGKIYVKQDGDTLVGTKMKELGVNIHNNDIDYCEYTDTLISANVPDDNLPMALYLLTGAKSKLYSSTDLTENDWIKILMPQELDSEYAMVANCFGERCDIVYAIVIDKDGFSDNTNKRLLKIRLGMTNGVYDGTYTMLSNREWPTRLEIQGSKYCNGKLYVSTDSYINTGSVLHAGVTVIDVENLRTVEYVAYANETEKSQRIECEGIAFIGSSMYQIVSNHTLGNVTSIREYSIMNL